MAAGWPIFAPPARTGGNPVTYEAVQPEAAPATARLPAMPDPAAIDGWVAGAVPEVVAAGSPWGAPASLGPCTSTCVPNLAAARDGSIAVVGWSPNGPTVNAAVRLGAGTWVSAIVGGSNARVTYVVAGNNAFASSVWPVGIKVKYHLALDQSDYR